MKDIDLLWRYFPDLDKQKRNQFTALEELYDKWNSQINLISRKDFGHLYERHVLHSLSISKFIQFLPDSRVLDVGTGGGFPAIPLAILFPETKFVAVDSIGKKVKVVLDISKAIGLKNLEAIQLRAEQMEGTFDFVVSRAVTNLSVLTSWVIDKISTEDKHPVSNGIICLKGGDLGPELKQAQDYYLLNDSQITSTDVSTYFEEEFFDTKKIIYLTTR